MDNLISRKMAIIQLSHNKTGDDDCDVVIQRDIETIKSLPSAQPEIIHCKDCRFVIDEGGGYMCGNSTSWVVGTDAEFGCVLAEMRTDEQTD